MPRKTYGAEEIVGILRDVEILNGKGRNIPRNFGPQADSRSVWAMLVLFCGQKGEAIAFVARPTAGASVSNIASNPVPEGEMFERWWVGVWPGPSALHKNKRISPS